MNTPLNAERMADIHEIRRRNLQVLVDEHAGGNLTRFVEVTLKGLMSYKGLQHVTSPGKKRNLGDMLARRIEVQLHLQRGWMDHDRSGTAHTAMVPGGRSERVVRMAELIESLTPRIRALVEQLVVAFHKMNIRKRGSP